MSIDFKIQNLCDHYINWERISLPNDRVSVNPSYPLASLTSLILRINNVIISNNNYKVYLNKNDMVLSPKSIIVLNSPCPFNFPIVELRYLTLSNYCPKCNGTLYIDDLIYGPDKDVVTIKDEYLLIQTFEKLIVTRITSNKYYSWIGTSIHDLVGQKISDLDYLKTKIVEDINKAVTDLKDVENQYISSGRPVSQGELFGQLLSVDLNPQTDPTTIEVLIGFTAQSGKSLQLQQFVQLSKLQQR
jgi:hypothetical protein